MIYELIIGETLIPFAVIFQGVSVELIEVSALLEQMSVDCLDLGLVEFLVLVDIVLRNNIVNPLPDLHTELTARELKLNTVYPRLGGVRRAGVDWYLMNHIHIISLHKVALSIIFLISQKSTEVLHILLICNDSILIQINRHEDLIMVSPSELINPHKFAIVAVKIFLFSR